MIKTLLKFLGFIIIVLTSIILPLSLLESSMADLTNEFIEWSGNNKFLNSILVIFALAKKILTQEDLEKSEEVAKKFGVSILLIARPAPGLAEISTVAAGLADMKWITFLTVMILSNLLISVVYAFIGTAALTSQSASIAFIGIALIPFLFWLLAKRYF